MSDVIPTVIVPDVVPTAQAPTPPAEKLLTQAQFDAAMQDRVARAQRSAQADILAQVGATTLDELRDLVSRAKTPPPVAVPAPVDTSGLDALRAELAAVKEAQTAAEKRAADAEAAKQEQALTSAAADAVKTAGAVDAEAALVLLRSVGALDSIVGADGTLDAAKLAEVVEKLKTDKPFLFAPRRDGYKGIPSSVGKANPAPDADRRKTAEEDMKRLVFAGRTKP